jgi:ABC-type transporter Mla MlaB component
MLKISQAGSVNGIVTLKVEGRLVGPWVGELRKACEFILKEGRTLKLDLADVSYVDAKGVAVLTDFRSRGAELQKHSPFVDAQLKAPMSN